MTVQQKSIFRLGILLAALLAGVTVARLAPLAESIGSAGSILPAVLSAGVGLHLQIALALLFQI